MITSRPVHSYLPSGNVFVQFWRYFGAVSVAPHGVEHVLVCVRVASLFAQAELKQSQWRVGLEIASRWWRTRDNARTAPRMSIRHNRTAMSVSHLAHTRNTQSIVTLYPLSRHSYNICSLCKRNSFFCEPLCDATIEPRTVSEWTGLPGEESVKRFERSNGLDTSLYKTIPLPFVGPNGREGW